MRRLKHLICIISIWVWQSAAMAAQAKLEAPLRAAASEDVQGSVPLQSVTRLDISGAPPPDRASEAELDEIMPRGMSRLPVPRARIDTRLQSRISNRMRNRIDRNYDPRANALDPFATSQRVLQQGRGGLPSSPDNPE